MNNPVTPEVVESKEMIPAAIPPNGQDTETIESSITPFEGDYLDVSIQVANKLAEYEKAINTIMNFIVRRTYTGDWISHDRESTPIEERTVNMNGAAAERIARDLGIQETNRTAPVKVMDEKHPGHYKYMCEADFTFRGRTVRAMGISSTLNPFYSKAYGEMKKPEDIREEYLMRECQRDATKQGIKGLFGLRRIPLIKLRELGYDISKVKYVNFKEGEKSASKANPSATAVPQGAETPVADAEVLTIQIDAMEAKVSKNGKPFFSVKDSEGIGYYVWGNAESDLIMKLKTSMESNSQINVVVQSKGGYSTIKEVRP